VTEIDEALQALGQVGEWLTRWRGPQAGPRRYPRRSGPLRTTASWDCGPGPADVLPGRKDDERHLSEPTYLSPTRHTWLIRQEALPPGLRRGFYKLSPEPSESHFTPTSGSWLNLVEAFFSIITRQALRRGNFPTVADLIAAIDRFIAARNDRCAPFTRTKDPDSVIAKATNPRRRKTSTASVTEH
jgi:hypothetical protein